MRPRNLPLPLHQRLRSHLSPCHEERTHRCELSRESYKVPHRFFTPRNRPSTILVSVMTVNNEIGVVQPIKEIGALCRKKGVYLHTDAAQGLGKVKLDVNAMNIDLMSMSSHKIYGPKGLGAIYVRRKPRVKIETQMLGGGQERGYRSGTLPVPVPFLS